MKDAPVIMTLQTASEVLHEFHLWRRGEGQYEELGAEMPYSPKTIGLAIDKALDCLSRIEDLKLSCERINEII